MSEQNWKRILQAIEASKSPGETNSNAETCRILDQDSISSDLKQTNSQILTVSSKHEVTTSVVSIDLPPAIENHKDELSDHCVLVDRILKEISVVQYRIDYGRRDRMQNAVLKVHWDEWTHLRRECGDKPLLELFRALRQNEVVCKTSHSWMSH